MYLLSPYKVPDTVRGSGGPVMNKTDKVLLPGNYILVKEEKNYKQVKSTFYLGAGGELLRQFRKPRR